MGNIEIVDTVVFREQSFSIRVLLQNVFRHSAETFVRIENIEATDQNNRSEMHNVTNELRLFLKHYSALVKVCI